MTINKELLIKNFKVPEEGIEIIDQMLSKKEQHLVSFMIPGRKYSREEVNHLIAEIPDDNYTRETFSIESLYHRGVINLCEAENVSEEQENYELNNFLSRLDIFATEEYDLYSSLPRELTDRLDELYFDDYVNWLKSLEGPYPTDDEIRPLEDVLAFIEGKDETPYLADCDCRSLARKCDAPRDVCITYRNGVRSYVRRGLAVPITKEEAKALVIRAEEEGLIHTINPGGVCSCCHDCCYLFRSQTEMRSQGIWPKVFYKVHFDDERCISCGFCQTRCRFGVFKQNTSGDILMADTGKCQGCGLCVSTCPAGALSLETIEKTIENQ